MQESSRHGTTIALAIALIALGVGGYLLTGRASVTALIPAFFGVPLAVLAGLGARSENRGRRGAGLAILLLSVIGGIGSVRGIYKTGQWIGGVEIERPAAAVLQAAMAILCAVIVSLHLDALSRKRRPPSRDEPEPGGGAETRS